MSKRLKMPTTINNYTSFVEENKGLKIEKGTDVYEQDDLKAVSDYVFALEPNEMMGTKEIEIEVPDYETVTEEYEIDVLDFETVEETYEEQAVDENGFPIFETEEREIQEPVFDEEGNPVLDEEGNQVYETKIIEVQVPKMETKTREVQKPVMIEVEETIMVPDFDEETGEQTGEHEETITKQVQSSHKETRTREVEKQVGSHTETIIISCPVINPNYEQEEAEKRRQAFLKDFFKITVAKTFVNKGYAYYRKQPQGYSSAIESITFAERMCSKMNGLPEGIIKLYKEPNFTKPEQCTEEWLIANQIVLPALTAEQFDNFFIAFGQAWNTQEHEQPEPEQTEDE